MKTNEPSSVGAEYAAPMGLLIFVYGSYKDAAPTALGEKAAGKVWCDGNEKPAAPAKARGS